MCPDAPCFIILLCLTPDNLSILLIRGRVLSLNGLKLYIWKLKFISKMLSDLKIYINFMVWGCSRIYSTGTIDILYTLDSASLLVKLKPRIFQWLPPFEYMGVAGGGAAAPPSLLGKQSQSGNICFTVGQYWLIIKINWDKFCQFLGNSVNFVGNMLSNRNFS
jgi:hypothetical protein